MVHGWHGVGRVGGEHERARRVRCDADGEASAAVGLGGWGVAWEAVGPEHVVAGGRVADHGGAEDDAVVPQPARGTGQAVPRKCPLREVLGGPDVYGLPVGRRGEATVVAEAIAERRYNDLAAVKAGRLIVGVLDKAVQQPAEGLGESARVCQREAGAEPAAAALQGRCSSSQ